MKSHTAIYFIQFLFVYSGLYSQKADSVFPRDAAIVHVEGTAGSTSHYFKKCQITDEFWCEGAGTGDFNRDGKMDICGGPFWWEGPDFIIRHVYRPGEDKISVTNKADGSQMTFHGFSGAKGIVNDYSDNFLTYVEDFNHDGFDDILVCDFPGKEAFWYENPNGKNCSSGREYWTRHLAVRVLDNESPIFGDITGDDRPELICNSNGFLGYAVPEWNDPAMEWTWHPISPRGAWHKFTHGIGIGDINGDGRADLLEQNGWWEQPASLVGDPVWTLHEFPFATGEGTAGAAQMLVYDFNGDGMNDVLTTLDPHGYGIAWYEQKRENSQITFIKHVIIGSRLEDNKYGVRFSQAHALILADIDGDGLKDFVTGKRFWAHGPEGDEEPDAPAVLYWFKLVRGSDKTADFIPNLIDNNSGVGMQITVADVNSDGLNDIVTGNKKGIFVFIHESKLADSESRLW